MRPASDASALSGRAHREGATAAEIEQLLRARLQPEQLWIRDDSAAHAGHASAGGKGHFRLRIVSTRFAGLTTLQRHRLVNEVLATLWDTELHAVSLTTLTPDEFVKYIP